MEEDKYTLIEHDSFTCWLDNLKDKSSRLRIVAHLRRMAKGNFGDHKGLGDGLSELKLDFGPGYRVYFGKEGDDIILLTFGGDKSTQSRDIDKAKRLLREWKEERGRQ